VAKRKAIRDFGSSSAEGEGGGGYAVKAAPGPLAPSPERPAAGAPPMMALRERKMADYAGHRDREPMQQAPMANPLRAGATDDNAEFAEFVKFLASWSDRADTAGQADLMDVRDRRFVKVADAKGQPSPPRRCG
jgi:hypothetical protein